jgi:hypothetical protein
MADASVTVGADATEMRQELAKAAQDAERGGERIGKGLEHASGHGEHLLASSHRVARQIDNVAKSALSGGNAADVLASSMEGLAHSLHLPLGALAGLGIGAMVTEKIAEAYNEAKKLHLEILAVTAGDTTAGKFKSLSELNAQLDELRNKSKELRHPEGRTLLEAATDFVTNRKDKNRKDQALLSEQARGVTSNIAGREEENASISETRYLKGDFEAEREKATAEYREKRASNVDKYGNDNEALMRIQAATEREYNMTLAEIAKKEEGFAREISLAQRLQYVKERGRDVDIESARIRMEVAQEELRAATNDDEREKARDKIEASRIELDQAIKTTALKRAQVAAETELANFEGSSEQKRAKQLEIERNILEYRKSIAKPDELPEINRDIAKNDEGQRDLSEQIFNKQLSGMRARSKSNTGRGPDQEIAAANRELNALNIELDEAKRKYGESSIEVDQINAKLVDQKKRIEDIQFQVEQQYEAEKARTAEMVLQEHGQNLAAKEAQIRAEYEQKIAAALRDQNTELAGQYQKQQAIALLDAKIEEYMKTPEQRRKEYMDKVERDRAANTIEAREKDKASRAKGYDPQLAKPKGKMGHTMDRNEKKKPDGRPDAPSPGVTGAKNATMAVAQMTVEMMNVTNLKVQNFDVTNE